MLYQLSYEAFLEAGQALPLPPSLYLSFCLSLRLCLSLSLVFISHVLHVRPNPLKRDCQITMVDMLIVIGLVNKAQSLNKNCITKPKPVFREWGNLVGLLKLVQL